MENRQFKNAIFISLAALVAVFFCLMLFLPKPQPREFVVPRSMFKSNAAWNANKQAIREAVNRNEL